MVKHFDLVDKNSLNSAEKDALEIIKDIENKYPLSTSNSLEFIEIKQRLESVLKVI